MKKVFAMILTLVMILSLCGMQAFAQDTKVTITAETVGLGDTDNMLNSSGLVVSVVDGQGCKLDVSPMGLAPLSVFLKIEGEQFGFCVPDLSDNWYMIDAAALQNMSASLMQQSGTSINPADFANLISADQAAALLERYTAILSGIITPTSLSLLESDYTIDALGETVYCTAMTFAPTAEEWASVLTELFQTVKDDADLAAVIDSVCSIPEIADSLDVDDPVSAIKALCDSALADIGSISQTLAAFKIQVAVDSGALYCINLLVQDQALLTYAGIFDAEGVRKDILTYSGMTLLYNELTIDGAIISGFLTSDLGLIIEYVCDLSQTSELGLPFCEVNASYAGTSVTLYVGENLEEGSDHMIAFISEVAHGQILAVSSSEVESFAAPEGPAVIIQTEDELFAVVEELSALLNQYYFAE